MSQAKPSASSSIEGSSDLPNVHAQWLSDKAVQFTHGDAIREVKPSPAWLEQIFKFIGQLIEMFSPVISVMFWIGLACLVALLIYFIATEILHIDLMPRRKVEADAEGEAVWQPNTQVARDLLAAADQLAAEGKYNEAVHLILLRSIEDIERFRPRTIRPALTARDIGAMSALPEAARPIFARISAAVEMALFADLTVDPAEFAACREAYARFALPQEWRS